MVCSGCNKPMKQVLLKSPIPIAMLSAKLKESLVLLNVNMLNEVCKTPGSNTAFLHFASAESASVFYNHYVDKGVTINGVPFTVHGAKYRDGEFVMYGGHKNLNFEKHVVNSAAVPQFIDTTATTLPESATTVPVPVSATATTVPVSTDANATTLPESTNTNVTTVPTSTNTNTATLLIYWYW